MKFLAALILMALPALAASDVESISGAPRIVDGDTLVIDGTRIRLHGIDAPEVKQICQRDGIDWLCGQDASKALRNYVGSADLRCKKLDTDRYGRMVARCYRSDELDIGEWMVSNGWALAYRRYSKDYVDEEADAKTAERGLWVGEFVEPWVWRRR
ncbi:MAG: thermonuclease family protein [Rhodospirillaceae bacterium]|nr:thermonuclease family protein [Rhodospirillaceae bacterium]